MRVNSKDGTCRSCHGELRIIDVDDATMTVERSECGDTYLVEPDAFGDGAIVYFPGFLAEQMERGESQ